MVVEAASWENTLSVSFGHDLFLSVLDLSIADHPVIYWSCNMGKIQIYLILKITNAIWEIMHDKFWNQR